MFGSEKFISKFRVEVVVTLKDGRKMCGDLFLNHDERVLDLFNDQRAFVPLEHANGEVSVLSKASIMRITPTQQNLPIDEPARLKAVG